MTAHDLLRALAERATHLPAPPGEGVCHHVHTRGRYKHTAFHVDGRKLGSSVQERERRQWIAPDGSGRLLVTRGDEEFPPTGDYPPGGLSAEFLTATDPAVLAAAIRDRNPNGTTAGAIRAFVRTWNNQVVTAAVQRALLLDLAGHPDLTFDGPVTDHAGRPGVAVSHAEGGRLVFDEDTGALLGAHRGSSVTVWLSSGYAASPTA
ncbi:hypothetical protein [Umezawaea sp. NPDC059074]|uniref:hypothetical protein n=1 Tax=Umezawaea sp. NPDC059074 TaxID=3346716 RepID=UPI0036BAB3CC